MSSSTSSSDLPGPDARTNFRTVGELLSWNLVIGLVFTGLFLALTLAFLGGVRGTSSDRAATLRTAFLLVTAAASLALYVRAAGLRPCFRAVMLSVVAFLTAGEVYFRATEFGWDAVAHPVRYLPASVDYPLCRIPVSAETHTGFAPDTVSLLKGARFETNAFGFRDRPRTVAKPPDTIRIVVVGASMLMGAGVHQEEVVTHVLEDLLNEEGGPFHYEVLNLSRGAYHTIDQVDAIEKWGLRFDPDVFVVRGNAGDRETLRRIRTEPSTPLEILSALYHYPYSVSFFMQAIRAEFHGSLVLPLTDRLRGRSRPPARAAEPDDGSLLRIEPMSADDPPEDPRERRYLELAAGRPVFAATLKSLPERDLMIYVGDPHASAKAHRRYAEELREALEPVLAEIRREREAAKAP